MENNIAKELIESFGYEHQVSEAGALATGAKMAGKAASKALPFVGTALSAEDAISRWQSGDKSGAVISTLAGLGYLIPGPAGWVVGMGLDALNTARDFQNGGDETDTAAMASTKQPQSANMLQSLQKIIGAKPDGIYGSETKEKLKIWQAKQKIKVDGLPGPETYTAAGLMENNMNKTQTLGEKIAELRDKLAIIEETAIDEGLNSALLANAIWSAAKKGAGSADEIFDFVKDVFKKQGTEITAKDLPANFKTWADQAISTEFKKRPPTVTQPSKMAPELARLQRGKDAMAGIKAQELAAREAAIARMSPQELAKAGLSSAEQQSIKRGGLMAWVKQNPKKSAAVLAALGIGTAMMGSDTDTGGIAAPGTQQGAPSSKKRGDPEIMKQQELLNALTGSNLKIDGIWGPATQAAADKWQSISASQNADINAGLAAIPNAGKPAAPVPVQPQTQPSAGESDAYKEITKNVPKAVSESDELTRILQLIK